MRPRLHRGQTLRKRSCKTMCNSTNWWLLHYLSSCGIFAALYSHVLALRFMHSVWITCSPHHSHSLSRFLWRVLLGAGQGVFLYSFIATLCCSYIWDHTPMEERQNSWENSRTTEFSAFFAGAFQKARSPLPLPLNRPQYIKRSSQHRILNACCL